MEKTLIQTKILSDLNNYIWGYLEREDEVGMVITTLEKQEMMYISFTEMSFYAKHADKILH
jgi:hypothetical protein